MVDPQPGDVVVGDQLQHPRVGCLEHARVLHPERAEVVHVEEAPVIDFVEGGLPVRETVGLPLEQFVKSIECRRLSGRPLKPRHAVLDERPNRRRAVDDRRETLPDEAGDFMPPGPPVLVVARGDGRNLVEQRQDRQVPPPRRLLVGGDPVLRGQVRAVSASAERGSTGSR